MKTTPGPQLKIRLLGGIGARHADGTEIEIRSRGSALLLARLAHPVGQVHRREALIDALFPDDCPESGRTKLRQCLYLLRQELASLPVPQDVWLRAERETIRLVADVVTTDAGEFTIHQERARRAGSPAERAEHLTAAMLAYTGEFLPGHFDDWVLAQRERLNEQHAAALCDLSSALIATGELSAAVERARQAVGVDRLREESHRALMRAFAASGRPTDAERQYRELERLLRDDLGVVPSAATRHLRDEIQSGQVASPVEDTMTGADSEPATNAPLETDTRTVRKVRLPQPLTRFYGRAEEIARIERLLAGEANPGVGPAPLVTLTGPGGAGKTRLALEIAHRLDRWFDEAVWFVSLEAVTDARGVLDAISQVLDLPRTEEASVEQLAERLRRHRASLLILDNFEHLVQIAALHVQELRSMVPGLACLVSSRQRLSLRGEQELNVSPLPVPAEVSLTFDTLGPMDASARMLSFAGVQLFVDRAQAVRASFRLTPENAAQVGELCRRLDGIPLALELGAAWLSVLSPQQALDRLFQGSAMLIARNQDIPERHRTLQSALDSSYLLLAPVHQCLFRRLSVFRDGWTLEAAEAVCGSLMPPGEDVLEALALLVERSLVQVDDRQGPVRYRLLETMRQYGATLAAAAGETVSAGAAHAEYYHSLAVTHNAGFNRAGREGGLDVVEADLENGRAALAWLAKAEVTHQQALELAGALGNFCWIRGRCAEGALLVERTLANCSTQATPARFGAYKAAASLARLQGDDSQAFELLLKARSIASAIGDLRAVFGVANSIAGVLMDRRDMDAAKHWINECRTANQTLGDPALSIVLEFRTGCWADRSGKTDQARDAFERCVTLATEYQYPRHRADALSSLGWTFRVDDPIRGVHFLTEGLKIHRDIGHSPMVMETLLYIGALELASGHLATAARSLRESLQAGMEMRQRSFAAASLAGLAATEAAEERWERAALLFGASETIEKSVGKLSFDLQEMLALDAIASRCSRLASEQSVFWKQGTKLGLEEAAYLALTGEGIRVQEARNSFGEPNQQSHEPSEKAAITKT